MPVIRYENEIADLFQHCSWDSVITLKDEKNPATSGTRMQRASSVAYTTDTRHEQPLLQLLLPNKVEYYCNSSRRHQFSATEPNSNPRRHSFGNCEIIPQKSLSPIPPPIPARINKVPAIPKRKSVPKLALEEFPSPTSHAKPPVAPVENGFKHAYELPSDLTTNKTVQVKLPPPPQASHSKRSSVGLARTNETQLHRIQQQQQQQQQPSADSKMPQSNGSFPEVKTLTPLQNAALFNSIQNKSTDEGYFKFPKVVSVESLNSPRGEEYDAFSHTRRKSGKKIPPPIRTHTDQRLDEGADLSKIPSRHDSILSSSDGGVSQTSSPSYLIRSLESPLLPNAKTHSSNKHHSKHKFMPRNLFSDMNDFAIAKDNGNLSVPDLTKSQSTPGGLQTVVDFHPGASSSYQHKVIRREKGAILKFQIIPITINFIVLLMVATGTVLFLRASHEKSICGNLQNVSVRPFYFGERIVPGEESYYCTSLTARFCIINNVPYNYTMLPNYFGSHQSEADVELDVYEAITNVRCYRLAPLYLCSLYVPKCGRYGQPVKPCKRLCEETHSRCGLFLEVFGLQLPKMIDCAQFPDSNNPDECIGNLEVAQHLIQEQTAVCHDGFKCDQIRCIPADWRCDGHIDCEDKTDESNCTQCPGKLHCGNGQCIATSHICDGEVNCPRGQDERNCVRLNEQMGNIGYGTVEVFAPKDKEFKTACIREWDQLNSPKLMCELLGYEYLNNTEFQGNHTRLKYIQFNKEMVEENKAKLYHQLKSCPNNGHYPTVRARCSSYACGIRKLPIGLPSARIVGGIASNPGDWPFIAAVLGGPKEIFYCAGVLISDQWVLSAAHCVGNFNLSYSPLDWTIQLGMTRRSSHSYFEQKLKVQRVIPHPDYNQGIPHNNDIALFQLRERVKFHDHLLPVCMPNKSIILQPKRECTVIGWGKRKDNDTFDYEPTVYEVQVPILNNSLCNKWLQRRDLNVSPGMICAGYEQGGKDACQGDSGGPLLCQEDNQPNKWFVGGIVSWGIKCAHPHLPGIYANVPHFIPWIERQVNQYSEIQRY